MWHMTAHFLLYPASDKRKSSLESLSFIYLFLSMFCDDVQSYLHSSPTVVYIAVADPVFFNRGSGKGCSFLLAWSLYSEVLQRYRQHINNKNNTSIKTVSSPPTDINRRYDLKKISPCQQEWVRPCNTCWLCAPSPSTGNKCGLKKIHDADTRAAASPAPGSAAGCTYSLLLNNNSVCL